MDVSTVGSSEVEDEGFVKIGWCVGCLHERVIEVS